MGRHFVNVMHSILALNQEDLGREEAFIQLLEAEGITRKTFLQWRTSEIPSYDQLYLLGEIVFGWVLAFSKRPDPEQVANMLTQKLVWAAWLDWKEAKEAPEEREARARRAVLEILALGNPELAGELQKILEEAEKAGEDPSETLRKMRALIDNDLGKTQ